MSESSAPVVIKGFMIENITSIGSAEQGDFISWNVHFQGGKTERQFIPYRMLSGFITGVLAAAGLAHRDQMAKLGEDDAVLLGASTFHPSHFDIGNGRDDLGNQLILLRLKLNDAPVNITLGVTFAEAIANALLAQAQKMKDDPKDSPWVQ